jgi:phosphate transport system ATP-binding protein
MHLPFTPAILQTHQLSVTYGKAVAIQGVCLEIYQHQVTSFIGPSGCGKSTLLRCFNRLNELLPNAKVGGKITLAGQDLQTLHPIEVRRRVGMVFQRPNPFPKSIYENVAVGLRVNGYGGEVDARVECALRQANLWSEVKDKLRHSALELSGGQQQRLCIARAIALNPEILLMDEPCSALDPVATLKIEELILSLRSKITTIIVTHNMQQASRLSDYTAFFNTNEQRIGHLVEFGATHQIFCAPQEPSTRDYLERRYG